MLRKFISWLNGRSASSRGQSLVELTVSLPLFLIMLLGLAEIGWYANNYLTLLDVVREAGRFGSTRDPMRWIDGEELSYSRMDCEALDDHFDKFDGENTTGWNGPNIDSYGFYGRTLPSLDRPVGYYDGVACTAVRNMDPLVFKDAKDDVVVSVFSFIVLNEGTSSAEIRIVGRYPSQANECSDEGDPFDWNHDGDASDPNEDPTRWEASSDNVRGYVFRGNHHVEGGSCLGSEFSTQEVQDMLNFTGDPDRVRKMEQTTNYGLVLVEVFWAHKQLLGLPWFNLGPMNEDQIIHVWTFFPVSAAEPDVE
jgi:hypothetical protein